MAKRLVVGVVAVASMAVLVFAQGPRRDGEWEVKAEMSMPNMPATMPAMTLKQCITPAEASDPQKTVPAQRGRNMNNCKISDYKIDGNTVSWSMACEGEQAMTAKGRFTYEKDTYTGTMTIDAKGRGGMTMKYNGKRLGDCVK